MRIVPGSSSSFLCPPGHPMLTHAIEDGRASDPTLIAGLDYALRNEYGDVPDHVRAKVQRLYDEATPVRSELWERNVYGYFHGCYSPDGTDRNVTNMVTSGPIEHHLGYLLVRSYFPDAKPRAVLTRKENGLYGQLTCKRCERSCQYEAKVNAFALPITGALCTEGQPHDVDIPPVKPFTIDERVARGKREILADIAAGTVPAEVADFSTLHDYVDANYYGGFFDHDDEIDTPEWSELMDLHTDVQDVLHAWLVAGRPAD